MENRSELLFATFIDDTLRSYAKSAQFRAALHNEAPGAGSGLLGICPPSHLHGVTGTCYGHHKCRCDGCREAQSRRAKRARMMRARAEWDRKASQQRRTA